MYIIMYDPCDYCQHSKYYRKDCDKTGMKIEDDDFFCGNIFYTTCNKALFPIDIVPRTVGLYRIIIVKHKIWKTYETP